MLRTLSCTLSRTVPRTLSRTVPRTLLRNPSHVQAAAGGKGNRFQVGTGTRNHWVQVQPGIHINMESASSVHVIAKKEVGERARVMVVQKYSGDTWKAFYDLEFLTNEEAMKWADASILPFVADFPVPVYVGVGRLVLPEYVLARRESDQH